MAAALGGAPLPAAGADAPSASSPVAAAAPRRPIDGHCTPHTCASKAAWQQQRWGSGRDNVQEIARRAGGLPRSSKRHRRACHSDHGHLQQRLHVATMLLQVCIATEPVHT
eukprot:358478-Chlamydomonas_euryale.AAC.11